jgi:hypothetical protein
MGQLNFNRLSKLTRKYCPPTVQFEHREFLDKRPSRVDRAQVWEMKLYTMHNAELLL